MWNQPTPNRIVLSKNGVVCLIAQIKQTGKLNVYYKPLRKMLKDKTKRLTFSADMTLSDVKQIVGAYV